QVLLLLLGGAVLVDDLGGAEGQARVHVERRVRAREELLDGDGEQRRRALAAPLGADPQGLPAGLVELLPRPVEARRHLDRAVLDAAALAVADLVERPQ